MATTASPFKLRPHRVIGAGIPVIIWGETEKLEIFLDGIEAAPMTAGVDKVLTISSHTVRRYPGDPGYTRRTHQRRYTSDIGLQGGITPGKNFWIEDFVLTDSLAEIGIDSYQFTHQGPFFALRAYCRANCKQDFRLRSSGGRVSLVEVDPD